MRPIFSSLRSVLLLLAFVLCPLPFMGQASAVRQHVVAGGETLYHISKVYGVSMDELLRANPGLSAETLKAGATLTIPASKSQPATPVPQAASATDNVGAALLLPLSATGIEGGRSLEFYRGVLMAAEKLKASGASVTLYGYDEKATDTSVAGILQKVKQDGVQVILGPVYPAHFAEVASFARANGIRMVVPFYSKVKEVNTNPYVYLVNTPVKFEQEQQAALLLKMLKTATNTSVAIMHMGQGSEESFAQYLKKRLTAVGCAVTEFHVDAPLEQMRSACNPHGTTLILPDDSRAVSLNKVLVKLEGFKKYYPNYATQVVGYGSWLGLEGTYGERMHAADAFVFTGSFYNRRDAATQHFEADYQAQFGEAMGDATPRMALLGYDVGQHVLGGILTYGKDFGAQATGGQQLQSRIRFEQTERDGGFVNTSLFLIHYKPDGSIDMITAK